VGTTAAAIAVSTVEPTVEPINHMLEAQVRVDELRAMRQVIPNFIIPTSVDATRRLGSAASLPPEFVHTAALAMRNSQALARVDGVTAFAIRDWMSFADAYDGVADEHEANAQFIRHSIAAARNRAGTEALMIYEVAKRLAKRPETAELAPYVADMRRALAPRFKKKPEKPAEPPVTPPATPEPDKQ
jgi:hypothetical protein